MRCNRFIGETLVRTIEVASDIDESVVEAAAAAVYQEQVPCYNQP